MESEYALESKKYRFKLVDNILRVESMQGKIREEIDLRRVTYTKCVTVSPNNYVAPIFSILLGVLIYYGFSTYFSGYYVEYAGIAFVLIGVYLFFQKRHDTSFTIGMIGYPESITYELELEGNKIHELMDKIKTKSYIETSEIS